LVVLPVSIAKAYSISIILCFYEVMINRGSHMIHINATKKTVPVGVVGLSFPQLNHTSFLGCSRRIDRVMNAQHFLMLVIDFWVEREEVAPEATTHELKDVVAVLFF